MKPRTRYALLTCVVAAVLFTGWRFAVTHMASPGVIGDAAFAIPGIAAIVAASASLKRKAALVAGLGASLTAGYVVASWAGVASSGASAAGATTFVTSVGGTVYHVFRLAVPIGAILLLADGDVARLWSADAAPEGRGTCPVCGKRKAGLEAHIRQVHGEKALRKLAAAGKLAR
ncbi:MAG: hypothetical protein HY876_06650 [Coriobacteriales bacterium]|nr:hypothetical protein [Coriobacteriales bacterium]